VGLNKGIPDFRFRNTLKFFSIIYNKSRIKVDRKTLYFC
jgi:hypothetical protein